ncbi:hypothetical protein JCM4814A_90400 [Streptomyces phaeofaciens JCM 4814]|uniref:Uncharacterized protein n=1 Tax=Streptomyces phaeofaciens TaxID=68254 RepID=A0A918HBB2_9ACTN|nr:hypothetical protein [Streptomyces phaeofaciens]GGT51736.1 hypothetical protein GCM10010226_31130 [Streptomyces phaeofaciens]
MRAPNYPLACALAEAGWNNSETARRINALAQERGQGGVAVDRSRVSRWIRHGEKPRAPVPELLTHLLTRQLCRPITPDLLGIGPSRSVLIALEPGEYLVLAASAAAANMQVEYYAQALLRLALANTSVTHS